MEPDPTIARIRAARHRISERFGHDPKRLVEHYMKLQERHKDRLVTPGRPTRNDVPEKDNDAMLARKVYQIDGATFSTLEEFFDEIGRILIPDATWGHNLDAFNDILRGGFGTPEQGFILHWKNSKVSRERLGYRETVRQLETRLAACHPANRDQVARDLEHARGRAGPTVFDWLVEVIQLHCRGGEEEQDGVELMLA